MYVFNFLLPLVAFSCADLLLHFGYGIPEYKKKHWWTLSPITSAVTIGWIFCELRQAIVG